MAMPPAIRWAGGLASRVRFLRTSRGGMAANRLVDSHTTRTPDRPAGAPRADRGRATTMGKLLALAALVASLLVASPAYAFRLRGAALSDSGVYVTLVLRARQIGNGLVGTIRCIRGSASCLFGRGRLSATFAADGSFTGGLLSGNGRTQCAFAGVLADGGLEGRYRCVRDDGAEDIGSFLVTP